MNDCSGGVGIYYDSRWNGSHGIGRFSSALEEYIPLTSLGLGGEPYSPGDPLRMYLRALFLPVRSVLLIPGYNPPLFRARPFIFTIHDLNHIDRPENTSFLKRLYYRFIIARACRTAFRVLTVSEYSRRRILDWSGVAPFKVVNVGNGVDDHFCQSGEVFSPGYRYFLCVSNRKAHKNELRLLQAFSSAHFDGPISLVFTGEADSNISGTISSLGLANRVLFLGNVDEVRLPSVYRGAEALVFPSLYEGFGLPVIEAMACGIPVLTSNSASLPEVAGGAALIVDPLSCDAIAKGMERLVYDCQLREELISRGLERAKQFRWAYVARRVENVLEDLIREYRA